MPVYDLAPYSVASSLINATIIGGLSVVDTLKDGSDATYVRNAAGLDAACGFNMEPLINPVGKPTAFTVKARSRASASTAYTSLVLQLTSGPTLMPDAIRHVLTFSDWDHSPELGVGSYIYNDLPSALLYFGTKHSTGDWVDISELGLRAYFLLPATVASVVEPGGTDTQYPHCEAALDVEVEAWQLPPLTSAAYLCGGDVEYRIYAAADVSGSEPPSGVSPVWSGFQRWSESTLGAQTPTVTMECSTPLENGDYVLFARASRDLKWGSSTIARQYWSDWESVAWTQDIALPASPELDFVADDDEQRVDLAVTGAAATGYDSSTATVEVQRLSGGAWYVVRALKAAPLTLGSPQAIGSDYEAARGVVSSYRARIAMWHAADEVTRYSPWATASVTGPAAGGWNLKLLDDPGSSWIGAGVATEPAEEDQGQVAVFTPLGRTRPVVAFGALSGAGGTLKVTARGTAEVAAAEALRECHGIVLLEAAFGDAKYVAVTSISWVRQGAAAAPRRVYSIAYAEVGTDLEAGA